MTRSDLNSFSEFFPDGIVISPGPKGPEDAGLSKRIISEFSGKVRYSGCASGCNASMKFSAGKPGKRICRFMEKQALFP